MYVPPSGGPINLTATGEDSPSLESSLTKKGWEEKVRLLIQLLVEYMLSPQCL